MATRMVRAATALPLPYLIVAIVVLVLFVAWVVNSEQRTRHLAQLIRAWRATGPSRQGPGLRHGGKR